MAGKTDPIRHWIDTVEDEMAAEEQDGPWATIQMPTPPGALEGAYRIAFKNHCNDVKGRLDAAGLEAKTQALITGRLAEFVDHPDIWRSLHRSLIVTANPHGLHHLTIEADLDDLVAVSTHPVLDDLHRLVDRNRTYAVLALSLAHVRLLTGDRYGLQEVVPEPLPSSLAEALGVDERTPLQSHASGRVGQGSVTASFHSQPSRRSTETDRFLRMIDNALGEAVARETPIVLAGVDRLIDRFRSLSARPNLLAESIKGNADRTSPTELHQAAWPLVASLSP